MDEKKRFCIININLLFFGDRAQSQTSEYPYDFTYNGNPLVRNHGAADPDAHVWNDTVWMYTSQDHDGTYAAMDGYHAFSSTDMINWTDHGEILHSRDVDWGLEEGGFMWAPGAARKNGKYYLYYPHRDKSNNWRIGVAISDKPQGPFEDIGAPMEGIGGIDPAIFIDDDDVAYIYNNNAIVAKLKPNMIELAESPRKINYDKTDNITDSYNQGFAEGSYMHKKDGIYYYSYSNWHNKEYQSFYAMGENPYGPFEWKGRLAPKPQGAQDHHSIIKFEGQCYYFYHIAISEYPNNEDAGQGRIACYDRLYYNPDGTIQLVVHTRGPVEVLTTEASNGFITLNPPGGAYKAGTEVEVTVSDDLGYDFDSWSGSLSGSRNPETIIMDGDKNVIANFVTTPIYSISVSAENGSVNLNSTAGKYDGKITASGGDFNEGTVVKLEAVDDEFGYDFDSWSGDLTVADNPVFITIDGDKNVTANFQSVPVYDLTTHAPNGTIKLTPPAGKYEEGTEVTVEAIRDYGYGFSSWSGGLSGSENPETITMDADKDVTANFTYIEGSGEIVFATNCGGESYKDSDGVRYSADQNYTGSSTWENFDIVAEVGNRTAVIKTFDIDVADGELNISFDADINNAQISAIKVLKPGETSTSIYTLTTNVTNGSIELTPAGGSYEEGTVVTVRAVPNSGFVFTGWSGDLSGTQNPTSLVLDDDKTVTAAFAVTTSSRRLLSNSPEEDMLGQNYPNPFVTTTTIPFQINKASHVKLAVCNSQGQSVVTLLDEHQFAGNYKKVWNGKSNEGTDLSRGFYIYELQIDRQLKMSKILMIIR